MVITEAPDNRYYVRQPDAVLSQANPVSTDWYLVFESTYVRIYDINAVVNGGTVSLLAVRVNIDEQVIIYSLNPTEGTHYYAYKYANSLPEDQPLQAGMQDFAFLLEGKVVKVHLSCTWTVQPSPVSCRIKWSRYI